MALIEYDEYKQKLTALGPELDLSLIHIYTAGRHHKT